jgi:predicted aspartyl protease
MPILHTQYYAEGQDKNGAKVQVAPQVVLSARGPVIQITLGIAENFAQRLIEQNKPVPEPIAGWALIDTGASTTCVDDEAAAKLALPAIDKVKMASASHDSTDKNVYPVLIQFIGVPIKANAMRAIGASLASQGIIALLGRDLLQNFTLFYNGLAGEITISL